MIQCEINTVALGVGAQDDNPEAVHANLLPWLQSVQRS